MRCYTILYTWLHLVYAIHTHTPQIEWQHTRITCHLVSARGVRNWRHLFENASISTSSFVRFNHHWVKVPITLQCVSFNKHIKVQGVPICDGRWPLLGNASECLVFIPQFHGKGGYIHSWVASLTPPDRFTPDIESNVKNSLTLGLANLGEHVYRHGLSSKNGSKLAVVN